MTTWTFEPEFSLQETFHTIPSDPACVRFVCVCARARACMSVHACVYVCVCVCAGVCVCVPVWVGVTARACVCVRACVRAYVRVVCVCV